MTQRRTGTKALDWFKSNPLYERDQSAKCAEYPCYSTWNKADKG